MTGDIEMSGAGSNSLFIRMYADTSNYRTGIGWKTVSGGTLLSQIGYWNTEQRIYINSRTNEISDVWQDAVGKYSLVVGKNLLTYNTYPLLHSGNYTSYTVTKTGVGASGTWGINISGGAAIAGAFNNNGSTEGLNYLRYHQISNDLSSVGSTAVGGAWVTPPISQDSIYGNGQILRLGWTQDYYTDIFTGPNGMGSRYGIQFRQVVAGSSLGWRTLIDTNNYASTLDSRYVKKSGDTMSGTLTLLADGNDYDQGIRINRPTLADWATLTIGCVGSGTNGTSANTWLIGTPANSNSLIFCLNASSDQKGLCLRDMTNMGIRWNGYSVWNAGNHGSGSGLDADLLDGYHASSFQKSVTDHYELNLTSNNTTDGQWNVLLLHEDTLSSAANSIGGRSVQGTFYFYRPTGNVVATINVNSGAGYNTTWGWGALSVMGGWNGWGSYSLVTCTYKGVCYRAIKFASGQQVYQASFRGTIKNKDSYFGVFVPYATTSGTVLDSEVNGSIKPFTNISETTYLGDIIAPTFRGSLSGNASSATKLSTARTLWGQSFDGTGNVNGHIYLDTQSCRIFFGTSGTTAYLSAADGYFSITSANNTSYAATLLRINLSNGAVWADSISLSNHLAVSGAEGRGITYTGNSIRLRAATGGWAIGIDPYHNDDTTSFSHSVGGAYGGNANTINYTYYGGTYNSPAMVILPNKNVGIGTVTPSYKLHVAGTIYAATGIWSSGWLSFSDLSSTSDRKFKDGIAPLAGKAALAVIRSLKPSTWTWNALSKVKGRSAGFVAQEVRGILPDAIREIGEDKHLALNYQMLHAYEVAALQEHDDEIQRLRERVDFLENELKRARSWQH